MGYGFDFGFEGNTADFSGARLAFFFAAEGNEKSFGKDKGPLAVADASRYVEFFEMQGEFVALKGGVYAEISGSADPEPLLHLRYNEAIKKGVFPIIIAGNRFSMAADLTVPTVCLWGSLGQSASEKKLLHDRRLALLVGTRAASREAFYEASKHVTIVTSEALWRNKRNLAEAVAKMDSPVHLSVDLDVFATSVVGSNLSIEPGGLGWYDFCQIVETLFAGPGVQSVDLVGTEHVEPRTRTALFGAQLLTKIAALHHQGRGKATLAQ